MFDLENKGNELLLGKVEIFLIQKFFETVKFHIRILRSLHEEKSMLPLAKIARASPELALRYPRSIQSGCLHARMRLLSEPVKTTPLEIVTEKMLPSL